MEEDAFFDFEGNTDDSNPNISTWIDGIQESIHGSVELTDDFGLNQLSQDDAGNINLEFGTGETAPKGTLTVTMAEVYVDQTSQVYSGTPSSDSLSAPGPIPQETFHSSQGIFISMPVPGYPPGYPNSHFSVVPLQPSLTEPHFQPQFQEQASGQFRPTHDHSHTFSGNTTNDMNAYQGPILGQFYGDQTVLLPHSGFQVSFVPSHPVMQNHQGGTETQGYFPGPIVHPNYPDPFGPPPSRVPVSQQYIQRPNADPNFTQPFRQFPSTCTHHGRPPPIATHPVSQGSFSLTRTLFEDGPPVDVEVMERKESEAFLVRAEARMNARRRALDGQGYGTYNAELDQMLAPMLQAQARRAQNMPGTPPIYRSLTNPQTRYPRGGMHLPSDDRAQQISQQNQARRQHKAKVRRQSQETPQPQNTFHHPGPPNPQV